MTDFYSVAVKKRSVLIKGHATSVTLEEPFWDALRGIAKRRGLSLNKVIEEIDEANPDNLSSAVRVFILRDLQAQLEQTSSHRSE